MNTGKPVVVGEAVGAWARYLESGVRRGEKTAKNKNRGRFSYVVAA